MDVHHVADDQRCAFVAAQHAGRERPSRRNFADVVDVDLFQFGIARGVEVAARHNPLLGISRQFYQFLIGARITRGQHSDGAKATCKQQFAHSFLPCILRIYYY